MAEETRSFPHPCIMPARRMRHNSVQASAAFTVRTRWERIGSESLTHSESRFVPDEMWWVNVEQPTSGVAAGARRVLASVP